MSHLDLAPRAPTHVHIHHTVITIIVPPAPPAPPKRDHVAIARLVVAVIGVVFAIAEHLARR